MLISIKHTDNDHVINLEGEFDAMAAEDVRQIFTDVLDKYQNDVVIDMSKVSFIDSSGIGALVYLYKRLYATSRAMALVGLNNQPEDMIKLLRMDRTIRIYQDFHRYLEVKQNNNKQGSE